MGGQEHVHIRNGVDIVVKAFRSSGAAFRARSGDRRVPGAFRVPGRSGGRSGAVPGTPYSIHREN